MTEQRSRKQGTTKKAVKGREEPIQTVASRKSPGNETHGHQGGDSWGKEVEGD